MFNYYKPLIDAKNSDENEAQAKRKVFVDEQFVQEKTEVNKDGEPNVNRLIKPFEMRLFELRK